MTISFIFQKYLKLSSLIGINAEISYNCAYVNKPRCFKNFFIRREIVPTILGISLN